MTPLLINGCFAWLHLPPVTALSRGVVLCPSLGNEAMNVHRAWVMLAEKLARAGLPVLRLSYSATGDSAGNEADPEGLADWTQDIADAADWLRQHAAVTEITLCGFRAGAALAVMASTRVSSRCDLVLMAPVVSGRNYIRELTISARAWDAIWMVNQPVDQGDWFEAAGVRLSSAMKAELAKLDLRKMPAGPALRALIIEPDATSANDALASGLAGRGIEVKRLAFDGYERLCRDALESEVPEQTFDLAVDWMADGAAGAARTDVPSAPARLETDCYTEVAVSFGSSGQLFGIYCTPAFRTPKASLLILNTGAHSHVGHSRFAVSFARSLARLGVASLRMDSSGVGDSDPTTGAAGCFYEPRGVIEACAGLDWLSEATELRVTVMGMCSGAYTALQAALHDQRVGAVALVNLQRFVWNPGTSLRVVQRNTKRTTQFYMQHLRTAAVWRRLRKGEIDVVGIGRTLTGRLVRRLRSNADPLLAVFGAKSRFGTVRRWFQTLQDRKIPVLFVLSENDPGLDELEEYFGGSGRRLAEFDNVSMEILHNADHTLSHHSSRQELLTMTTKLLGLSMHDIAQQENATAIAAE